MQKVLGVIADLFPAAVVATFGIMMAFDDTVQGMSVMAIASKTAWVIARFRGEKPQLS